MMAGGEEAQNNNPGAGQIEHANSRPHNVDEQTHNIHNMQQTPNDSIADAFENNNMAGDERNNPVIDQSEQVHGSNIARPPTDALSSFSAENDLVGHHQDPSRSQSPSSARS
jgi:hypothetical protein